MVDSSNIGVGHILMQEGEDGWRYPSWFGSITWNERERNYSQVKAELYRLMRALQVTKIHIIGVQQLVVEMDAKFVKGMINNPNVQPNATINYWIVAILLFDFEIRHVPVDKHTGADGLSRRPRAPKDEDPNEEFKEWVEVKEAHDNLGHKGVRTPLASYQNILL